MPGHFRCLRHSKRSQLLPKITSKFFRIFSEMLIESLFVNRYQNENFFVFWIYSEISPAVDVYLYIYNLLQQLQFSKNLIYGNIFKIFKRKKTESRIMILM